MSNQPLASNADVELIFLGTGTSGSVPNVSCLTAPPDIPPCRTCLSTLTPEGKKNIRRNTSAVLRVPGKDGVKRTILIDVGKNFQYAAVEWFPKHGLRRIDAVFITHPHADAMNGLDDLRAWTLRGIIQSHIDVYVSQATFFEVQRAFPYMVSKEFASGGGDVPEVKWHIFEEGVPFVLEESGIEILPFPVHHGRCSVYNRPKGSLPTPTATSPPTPEQLEPTIQPYICHAFLIQESIIYMGDVSHIPEETWALLGRGEGNPDPQRQYSAIVLDCLRPATHVSHFGLGQSVSAARRFGAVRTYLTGFGHEIAFDEYAHIGEILGGAPLPNDDSLTSGERKCLDVIDKGDPLWIRPAHDGLRVSISGLSVRDDTFDV